MRKHQLEHFLRNAPRTLSEKTLMSLSRSLFASIDTPRSLAAWILLENKEYAQLVNLEIDANHYMNAQAFADDYFCTKFLSKFPDFKHKNLNPVAAAEKSFGEFENLCKETNIKFQSLEEDPSLWDPTMQDILFRARRKISSVLRNPNLESISKGFGWGPGATSVSRGSYTSAYVKFAQRLDVTSNSLIMGQCCVNSIPAWVNCQLQTDEFPSVEASLCRETFNVVRGNEIVFVPKNAKTHRIIAKEPHVNSFIQKGFGAEIRRLLKHGAGVDLQDQTLNQRLARLGSTNGSLCTIDLSGASDTISRELVRFLLPRQWYSLLDQIRSKQGLLNGQWLHYQKFSSMGNACTFELESLIFWALCKSCLEFLGQDQTCNVYGDDIIVPTDAYELVAKVIDFSGFKINASKSYSSGQFRESCGKDYFNGTDVRPIFLKESVSNVEIILKLANSIRRYSHRRNLNYGCDIRFRNSWLHLVSLLPDPIRNLKIPDGYGDGGILVNFDEACPSRPLGGWEGFVFKTITRRAIKSPMRDRHAAYVACLSVAGVHPIKMQKSSVREDAINKQLVESTPLLGYHTLRDRTLAKVTQIHTHGWYDFGPWK